MAEQLGSQGAAGGAVARRMVRDDWEWIRRWFEYETLNTELGPLDDEWLEHVLTENDGVELVIEAAHPATGIELVECFSEAVCERNPVVDDGEEHLGLGLGELCSGTCNTEMGFPKGF
ncbi:MULTISPECIES: hypothetical protein [unclassified Leucobacter]|uniref:hypothetical protein n=1 Tax=unclassified Leucobacter TaxID=2621730 RepID=UPI00203C8B5B|nr:MULTISPECIES: hypothetical protein [unclassified Leucobacter]